MIKLLFLFLLFFSFSCANSVFSQIFSCIDLEPEATFIERNGVYYNVTRFGWFQYEGEDSFFMYERSFEKEGSLSLARLKFLLKEFHASFSGGGCMEYTKSFASFLSKANADFFIAYSRTSLKEMHSFLVVNVEGDYLPIEPQSTDPFFVVSLLSSGKGSDYENPFLIKWMKVKKCFLNSSFSKKKIPKSLYTKI